MPWQLWGPMEQRVQFIADYRREIWTMTELCARYGIARKTGYKWVARYTADGPAALGERSRRPQTSPTATPAAQGAALLALRQQHPLWGPRKLIAVLARDGQPWPARSTVARLLRRAGVVPAPRRRREPAARGGRPTVTATAPNQLWTADFKGHFRTGDGRYCYPLTVMDRASRYLLDCYGLLQPTGADTRQRFARLFAEYGLPTGIRTDNGTPFRGPGLAGLSRLAVWWIRLGIQLDPSRPAHPEDNGAHERFHRTLKAETTRPPAVDRHAQQRRFARHRREYNEQRPHEALGDVPPATCYTPSARPLPARLPGLGYPGHYEVRRVGTNGCLRWQDAWVFLSSTLAGEDVGLEPIDDGLWTVYLATQPLGRFDERTGRVGPTAERARAAVSAGPLMSEGPAPTAR